MVLTTLLSPPVRPRHLSGARPPGLRPDADDPPRRFGPPTA